MLTRLDAPPLPEVDPASLGALAVRALRAEVELTPKPGLVDRANAGSHADMDLPLFHRSIESLAPWFPVFVREGRATRRLPPSEALRRLRDPGQACEANMLKATGGINTHKGAIFSLGLLLAVAGRLGETEPSALCREVASFCAGLVETELAGLERPRTAGERAYAQLGLRGARGEAASGFATVQEHALPAFLGAQADGHSEEEALHTALLHLLAFNEDTNLVRRGGFAGLAFVQCRARAILAEGGVANPGYRQALRSFDDDLIARNLSPGGSADLLAVTWFLAAGNAISALSRAL